MNVQDIKTQSIVIVTVVVVFLTAVFVLGYLVYVERETKEQVSTTIHAYETVTQTNTFLTEELSAQLAAAQEKIEILKHFEDRDEYAINIALEEEIESIHHEFVHAVSVYEELLELRDLGDSDEDMDASFTRALTLLSQRQYDSASSVLNDLSSAIAQKQSEYNQAQQEIIEEQSEEVVSQRVITNNSLPSSGYSRQVVSADVGSFTVDIVAGDLSSTRVIVDTASQDSCGDGCPVLPLGEYVTRNGGYAGINGSYFCPATYPSCAGKTNSFDTLLMNKHKVYFNSDNNVYSTVPAVIFGNGWVRFVGQTLEWGRDTSIDGMIANQPLLVSHGSVVFDGDGDPKKGSRAGRSFVASRGNVVYIGVVYNATVAQAARVLAALGVEHALNLDSGGSTALWFQGYKTGPGRNIPNAIVFQVR